MKVEKCIDVCNKLLRGELSAIETYDQALDKIEDGPESARLRTIKADHTKSVSALRANIQRMGGEPDTDSGVWGTFAQAVQGGAKIFGKTAALKALKEGEEHGQNLYEEALNNEDVMPESKDLISNELLPRQIVHINSLDEIMENSQ